MFAHGNIDPCSSIKPSECWSKHQLHFFVARCVPVITIHWSGDWINHNTPWPGTQTSDAASRDRPYAALTRNWLDCNDEIVRFLLMWRRWRWFAVVCTMMINTVHTIHISCECECCVSWLSIVFTVIASLLWELKTGECGQSDINMSAFRSWFNGEIIFSLPTIDRNKK